MNVYHNIFSKIISVENLLSAWEEFERGKKSKPDVQAFSLNLMDNILELHESLLAKTYTHGSYYAFRVSDPKPRQIHKATVRDRLLHRAIYRVLYPLFDPTFIADSFSCRRDKGTHKAMKRFNVMMASVSKNYSKPAWALKCDIKKFFANIDQVLLMKLLAERIQDEDALWLFGKVLESFDSGVMGVGLPLGNITSQLFANVYMNELDQFVKHQLRVKYYIRYADDFIFSAFGKKTLEDLQGKVQGFLTTHLKLTMHPDKIILKSLYSGLDFLGFVHFPHHRVLRTTTRRRMMRKIQDTPEDATLQSYLGLMKHGDTFKTQQEVLNWFWLQ